MSDIETLQKKKLTIKIPAVNISTKKINSEITKSKNFDEKKSVEKKKSGGRNLT